MNYELAKKLKKDRDRKLYLANREERIAKTRLTIMQYKLAKRLKDAGFPNIELEEWAKIGEDEVATLITPPKYPTLSELIDACGEGLNKLQRGGVLDSWVASAPGITNPDWIGEKFGRTPEEAVALLWLALNKK